MKTYSDEPHIHQRMGVSFPIVRRPHINRRHVDGPLLIFRDGQMHWLTLGERLLLALGLIDAERLELKLRPNLMKVSS